MQALKEKYEKLLKKYGLNGRIILSEDKKGIDGNDVYIQNNAKIEEAEAHLTRCLRKVILPQLTLNTQRLTLRHFKLDDADDFFEFLSDRESCLSDGGFLPFEQKDEEFYALIKKFTRDKTRYAICLKEENKVVGVINLMEVTDRAVDCMEIGYSVIKNYRKNGYAFEAVSAMINFLQNEFKLELLLASAFLDNVPSVNLLKKLNFKEEGIKKKALWHAERGASDLIYYYKEI